MEGQKIKFKRDQLRKNTSTIYWAPTNFICIHDITQQIIQATYMKSPTYFKQQNSSKSIYNKLDTTREPYRNMN